jgi:hypothetical protein
MPIAMSRKMLIVPVSILSLCALLYFGVRHMTDTEKSDGSDEETMVSNTELKKEYFGRLRKLEVANERLNKEMKQIRVMMQTLTTDSKRNEPAYDVDDIDEEDSAMYPKSDEEVLEDAHREEESEMAALEKRIYSDGFSKRISDDVFYRMEDVLRDQGVDNTQLLSAACSASVCKLEVANDGSEATNQELLMKVATEYTPLENAAVVVASADDKDIVNIYYIKDSPPI